ncbi:hypothetical protein MPSEU_000265700 [Mayamaea pseudoterrestris]|nr:hypothetical protein MPSEU_000265700 [Mayamaea pseudoterrestris]
MTNQRVYSDKTNESCPFIVLGVALIVDQIGHGAHMALRYPIEPQVDDDKTNDDFFRLTPRQMAKLFRPKPPLCGQAMTLSVGETLFCCCATLLSNENDSTKNFQYALTADPENGNDDSHLSLFSVVVALAPRGQSSTVPINGWVSENTNALPEQQSGADGGGGAPQRSNHRSLSDVQGRLSIPKSHESEVSPSFQCIRRVHVSLARISRILLREERRCQYISLQCQLFKQIRSNVSKSRQQAAGNKKMQQQQMNAQTNVTTSPASMGSKSVVTSQSHHQQTTTSEGPQKRSHRRNASWNLEREVNERPAQDTERSQLNEPSVSVIETLDEEREAMEAILALSLDAPPELPPADDDADSLDGDDSAASSARTPTTAADDELSHLLDRGHCGNLAQELVAFYHALARRSDHQSPLDLLGGNGIIYVNQHVEVAIDAIAGRPNYSESSVSGLRPYHTLLFPKVSPSKLLASLTSAAPRLHQLLTTISPQKSLKEIAIEANLPLQIAMELATYLIGQGVCFASPALARTSVFCCSSIDNVHEYALEFVQTFGPQVNSFLLVSILTSGKSLGECMNLMVSSTDSQFAYLRHQMESLSPHTKLQQVLHHSHHSAEADDVEWREALEENLYSMAVWLRSRRVVLHLLEFLVKVDRDNQASVASPSGAGEKKTDSVAGNEERTDKTMFQELCDAGCLDGKTSIQSCIWRVQMDYHRLKAFAVRHECIRIVSRAPVPSDDW